MTRLRSTTRRVLAATVVACRLTVVAVAVVVARVAPSAACCRPSP